MAPPLLPGDAPIFELSHPGEIDVFCLLRNEFDGTVLDGLNSGLGKRVDLHKPLIAQKGFDDRMTLLTPWHHECVRLDFFEQRAFFEGVDDFCSCLKAVKSLELGASCLIHRAVGIHNIDHWEVVPTPHVVIIKVMGWSDLDAPSTKLHIHIAISDNRDGSLC